MAADEPGAVSLGWLETVAGYHLRRASAAFRADFARAVEELGMRQALLGILSVVEANPGIGQGAAGRALGIQRPNMVALVNELAGRGLIERRACPHDRRAIELALTPEGAALLGECRERIAAHEARMLAPLSADERATLLSLLRRLAQAAAGP